MTREEFIKQRCEIDKITEEEFEKRYRVVKCNCGQPYCKGYRCLDLNDLLEENQELKKQLEEKENIACNWKDSCLENAGKIEKLENQQKEFIDYLEDLIKQNETVVEVSKYGLPKNCSKLLIDFYKEILSKYKEIIGVSNENNT